MAFILASLVCLVGVSQAWLLNGDLPTVQAVGDVNAACQQHGHAGRCEFYECFEDRFPCGPRGYMQKYGLYYCHNFDQFYHMFTPAGKQWINDTAKCLTQRLMTKYTESSVDCHDLSHFAFDLWDDCYIPAGICDVYWSNLAAFRQVYAVRHLFDQQAAKIWREMFEITLGCGNQRLQEEGGVSGIFDQVRNELRNVGNQITNLGNQIGDLLGLK